VYLDGGENLDGSVFEEKFEFDHFTSGEVSGILSLFVDSMLRTCRTFSLTNSLDRR
jgi:hypothetical protein